jgi:dipeptidase
MTEAPPAYTTGRLSDLSWDSAWWVFNFVATVTHSRYRDMIEDVRAVQQDLEGHFLALQPAVERTAVELADSDPELMRRYLTDYAVQHAEQVVVRWKRLGEQLLRRYNDGYYQAEPGRPEEVGYPQEWLEIVVRERGDQLRLPKWEDEATDTELPY